VIETRPCPRHFPRADGLVVAGLTMALLVAIVITEQIRGTSR
jgi:hypothetical protein